MGIIVEISVCYFYLCQYYILFNWNSNLIVEVLKTHIIWVGIVIALLRKMQWRFYGKWTFDMWNRNGTNIEWGMENIHLVWGIEMGPIRNGECEMVYGVYLKFIPFKSCTRGILCFTVDYLPFWSRELYMYKSKIYTHVLYGFYTFKKEWRSSRVKVFFNQIAFLFILIGTFFQKSAARH